jgi:hypothetical protein
MRFTARTHQMQNEQPLVGPGPEKMLDHPPTLHYLGEGEDRKLAGLSFNTNGFRYYVDYDCGVCVGTVGDGGQVSGALCGVWKGVPPRRMEAADKVIMSDAILTQILTDKNLAGELRANPALTQFLGIELL